MCFFVFFRGNRRNRCNGVIDERNQGVRNTLYITGDIQVYEVFWDADLQKIGKNFFHDDPKKVL